MRVLHLTTEFPPVIYGGLGTAVGGWVTASSATDMTVGVLLVEGELVLDESLSPRRYGAGGIPQHLQDNPPETNQEGVVDRRGIRFFQASWDNAVRTGLRLVGRWRPDIIHLHTAMVWSVAQAIQTETGIPLVYHVHSVDRAEYEIGREPSPWLAHSEAQEAAIRAADRLIALSRDEAALLATYYPDASERVRIVGNGIAMPRMEHRRRSSGSSPLVLYSGRLVERKGIRELLAAIPAVLEVAPDTHFVLAGGPPNLTGDQVAEQWLTPELIAARGRIHFTGWLTPSQLDVWYRKADILVVPSRYEPFGMVVLEGMAYGLALVAARVGGPAEILEQDRTGLLFTATDVPDLVRALLGVVCDEGRRRRLGRAGRYEVRRTWTWPARVTAMRQIYAELADPVTGLHGDETRHRPARIICRPAA